MAKRLKVNLTGAFEIKRDAQGREVIERGSHLIYQINGCHLWKCSRCGWVMQHGDIVPNCKTVKPNKAPDTNSLS